MYSALVGAYEFHTVQKKLKAIKRRLRSAVMYAALVCVFHTVQQKFNPQDREDGDVINRGSALDLYRWQYVHLKIHRV